MLEKILNILYPPVCGMCGKINKEFLCDDCKKVIEAKKQDIVECYDRNNLFFEKHFYIFDYTDIIRKLIIDYKFNDCSFLYKTFEKILINDKIICDFIKCYDIIIPVPIHEKRKRERGYNQTYLIISDFIKELNYLYKTNIQCNNILIKVKNTNKQSSLNKKDRIENIKDSFCIDHNKTEDIKNKRLLIFDDVYTTGSTVNECAKVLIKENPKTIDVFTLAKD